MVQTVTNHSSIYVGGNQKPYPKGERCKKTKDGSLTVVLVKRDRVNTQPETHEGNGNITKSKKALLDHFREQFAALKECRASILAMGMGE